MCCIFGIGLFKDHKFKDKDTLIGIISRLFKEAESGGRKASGISIMREKSVHVLRRPLSATELIGSDEYMDFVREHLDLEKGSSRLMSVIGHCRWPTQGPPENNLNNHPLIIDNIIGVHNGVITNDHALFESFKDVITRKAEVDTEIIFQLIKHFSEGYQSKTVDAIIKTVPYLAGGYACAMQNTKHPYNLYLFKRGNPTAVKYYPELGLIFFGTRDHFMTKAVENFIDYCGEGEVIEMANSQGLVFNLWNNTMCRFDFKDNAVVRKFGKV